MSIERGITVLICSYNGAKYLPQTLQHIALQKTDSIPWELIVVDNHSTDNTGELASHIWKSFNTNVDFTLIYESRPGKNNAIDTGLEAARYSYVLICDDDNWLEENYLQLAFTIMESNPSIGILGGSGVPVFESNPPFWFDNFKPFYAVGSQNKYSGEVSKDFVWGAGSVVNKIAYCQLKAAGFVNILDYKQGKKLSRCEDIELCLAIRLLKYKVWYDERLSFKHFIPKEKLEWDYLIRLTKSTGFTAPVLDTYKYYIKNEGESRQFYWIRIVIKKIFEEPIFKDVVYVLFNKGRQGNKLYHQKIFRVYQFLGYLSIYLKFSKITLAISSLRKNIINKTVT